MLNRKRTAQEPVRSQESLLAQEWAKLPKETKLELEDPKWPQGREYKIARLSWQWQCYVPEKVQETWANLTREAKMAVYLTAVEASRNDHISEDY